MKKYRAQTPQNMALTEIWQNFSKTSTPLVNTEGLVPKRRATINILANENGHTPGLKAIMI